MSIKKNKTVYIVLIIILVATVIRIIGLSFSSMWLDEVASVRLANRPLSNLFTILKEIDNHPPLYYIFLHGWLYLSSSDFWIRLLSVFFGVATCVIVYFIGRLYYDEKFGILSALLVATQFWHVWASREARNFVVVAFFIVLSTYFFFKILAGNQKISIWLGYVLAMTAGIYTFYYAFLIFIPQNLFFLINWIRAKVKFQYWIFSQLAILFLYVFWIPFFLSQFSSVSSDTSYNVQKSSAFNIVTDTFESLLVIDPSSIIRIFDRLKIDQYLFLYVLVFLMVYILAILFFKRSQKAKEIGIWVFPGLLILPVLTVNILHYTNNLYNHGRYFSIFVPIFSFIVIGAILFVKNKKAVIALVIPLLLFNAYRSSHLWFEIKEEWKEAVSFVENDLDENDCMIFLAAFTTKSYDYYAKKTVVKYGIPRDLPSDELRPLRNSTEILDSEDLVALKEILKDYNRVWVVLSHTKRGTVDRGEKLLMEWLSSNNFIILKEKSFKGIRVLLYNRSLIH